jgi:hypothetical protein
VRPIEPAQTAIKRKIRTIATISRPSTAACRHLLHECRTCRPVSGKSPRNPTAKRENDFADKALRQGLPCRGHYDRNQCDRRFDAPKTTNGHELPRNSAPLTD